MNNNQARKTRGQVYLIHFESKLHHAQHYIGWATDVEQRFKQHAAGTGARLLAAVKENGINFNIVRIWEKETRKFERLLKNRKNAKHFCPVCSPETEKAAGH